MGSNLGQGKVFFLIIFSSPSFVSQLCALTLYYIIARWLVLGEGKERNHGKNTSRDIFEAYADKRAMLGRKRGLTKLRSMAKMIGNKNSNLMYLVCYPRARYRPSELKPRSALKHQVKPGDKQTTAC